MARPVAKAVSTKDLVGQLASGLRQQARNTNIYGYVPHAKQNKFHVSMAHMRLYIGGNRAGKTTAGVIEDIWWATGTHPFRETPPPPVQGRVVGVDFARGVELILLPEFKRWCPAIYLRGGSWASAYHSGTRILHFANGSTIEFMSYEQDVEKFAGTSRHWTHYDEEPPSYIFIECEARLIDTNGYSWMTMSPVEGMTWVYQDLYMKSNEDEGDIFAITVNMLDNPYINKDSANRFFNKLGDEEREAREQGNFVQFGGLIFKDFGKFANTKYKIPQMIPPMEWDWYMSMDHGFNNATCWLWHARNPLTNEVITFAEHYERQMIVDDHAKVVNKMAAEFKKAKNDYALIVGDPAIEQRNSRLVAQRRLPGHSRLRPLHQCTGQVVPSTGQPIGQHRDPVRHRLCPAVDA